MTTVEATSELTQLTKEELLAACEQFGVDFKKSMSKGDLINNLNDDGVTLELIKGFAATVEEDDGEFAPVVEEAPAAPDTDDDEDLVLVRMIRANNTYQIRGYTFKASAPFALVTEKDADYLIEVDGGFRVAAPKEAREYYS